MAVNEQPKTGVKQKQAEEFYKELLDFMIEKQLPFMIGGTYAFSVYTGIERPTKDIDIVTTEQDCPHVLQVLAEGGFHTKLHEVELNWMAKVYKDDYFTDIMYAERNGLHKVDDSWLKKARDGTVLDRKVKLIPVGELLRSKIYIQGRGRSDLPDVIHLILKQGKTMDWQLLLQKMDPHWELLASALFLFLFVYPSERNVIPEWVLEDTMKKLKQRLSHLPIKDRITRGLLLSSDYEIGISQWGFQPIRTLV